MNFSVHVNFEAVGADIVDCLPDRRCGRCGGQYDGRQCASFGASMRLVLRIHKIAMAAHLQDIGAVRLGFGGVRALVSTSRIVHYTAFDAAP